MSTQALRSVPNAPLLGVESHRVMPAWQIDAQVAIAAGFSVDEVIWMLGISELRSVQADSQDRSGCILRRTKVNHSV